MSDLNAYTNGYEVVAAHSPEEARAVLKSWLTERGADDDDDAVEGDGWRRVDPTSRVSGDDGEDFVSVQSMLDESPEPRHLWGVDR